MFRSTTTTDSGQQQELNKSITTPDGEEEHEQSTTTADGEQIQGQNPKDKKQEDSGELKPEPNFVEKKHENGPGQSTWSNVYMNIFVGITCGVVLVGVVIFGYRYRRRKRISSRGKNHICRYIFIIFNVAIMNISCWNLDRYRM